MCKGMSGGCKGEGLVFNESMDEVVQVEGEKQRLSFLRGVLNRVSGTARAGVKILGALLILGVMGLVVVKMYFVFGMGVSAWWLILPGVLMGVPLIGVAAFWYMLYCVANLPEGLKEAVAGTRGLKGRHRERLEKLEVKRGIMASFKRLRLTVGLLWDALWNAGQHGDVYGDAQMAIWMFAPWFWLAAGISVAATVVTQVGFGVFCLVHSLL